MVKRANVTSVEFYDKAGDLVVTFFGVRDSLHQIPLSVTVVARSGSTVAFFDGERLRALCTRSPENVAAVLERLG